jgi:hypothetical protein
MGKIANVGLRVYTPEMGEKKPIVQMEASRAYFTQHYFVDTPLVLKGQGITFLKTYKSTELTEAGQRKVGWHEYKVTMIAFDKLKKQYAIGLESLLN